VSHWALADIPDDSDTAPRRWFNQAEPMLALLEAHQPLVTVEVGSWKGGSAIAMARVVRQWGGVVYCVDTWTGDVTGGPVSGYPGMILDAAASMVDLGVAASIRLIPALSLDAAQHWQGPIHCLFIDADHTYPSVRADLQAWFPLLIKGGLIAGDDYRSPWYPGVTRAWDEFETAMGQTFTRMPTPDVYPAGMHFIYGVKP
jgi:predicted O-methyltransferase YrrM